MFSDDFMDEEREQPEQEKRGRLIINFVNLLKY